MYSDEDIQKVRDATDIVSLVSEHVPLKMRRNEFWGCCPFHVEKTPSFKVNPSTQLWHCFGCNQGGDVFKFIMLKNNLSFVEALEFLAERAHIEIVDSYKKENPEAVKKLERLLSLCDATADFYNTMLLRGKGLDAEGARKYLSARGFGSELSKKWQLGYAPGSGALVAKLSELGYSKHEMIATNVGVEKNAKLNDRFFSRIIFPIHDQRGRTIAFGGRAIGDLQPKYLNTSETSLFSKGKCLYGIDFAKDNMVKTRTAIVVEGYTDVIAMHEKGFTNTVATLGTALTPQHIKLIMRYARCIIYLFDGDEAGMRAAQRASELIPSIATPEAGKKQLELMVVLIPDGMDPADYLEKEGSQSLRVLIDEGAKPLVMYSLERKISACDLSTPERRAGVIPEILRLLIPFRESIILNDYLVYVSDMLGFPVEQLRSQMMRMRKNESLVQADITLSNTGINGESDLSSETELDHGQSLVSLQLNEQGRWEAKLLSIYIFNPSLRTILSGHLSSLIWENRSLELAWELLLKNATQESGAMLSKLAEVLPEANDVWTSELMVADSSKVEEKIALILKQRDISSLNDELRNLENRLKYSDGLDENEKRELTTKIVGIQKKLVTLRS